MAEKTVRLPDSRDVNRSWRRISTGRLSFLYSEEKILPNYLKSTTGSCHDVCKYGRKHEESEKKPRVSPLKRVSRSFSGTLNLDSPLRKKKALTKSTLNPSSVVGSDHHAKSQVGNSSSGACKKMKAERREKKTVSLSETRLVDSTKRKRKTVSQSFKTFGVSLGRAYSRSKEMVEHNRHVTALKLKSVAQTAAIALRRSTRKKTNGGSKTTEPKKTSVSTRASMSPKRCSRCLKAEKDSSSMTVPLSKTRKHVDEKCSDLVEEKTLYVIKMETGNEIVESDQNQPCVMDSPIDDRKSEKSQEESECIVTEADDESSQEEQEEEDDDETLLSKDKNTTRQGKSKSLSTESTMNKKSMKLRFKRGKTVEFGSQDNNPRKLKFKRGKTVTGDDTTSQSGGQKTKGTNFSNDKEHQHKPKSLKVVLKHQETQKKRDSRVLLFNNVIEETANKLVKTRKSKVKALVGAFESVISLQETNTSATTQNVTKKANSKNKL